MDRVVATTGDFDLSIGARFCAKLGIKPSAKNKLAVRILLGDETTGLRESYQEDTHRQGKARAGHYTTICK